MPAALAAVPARRLAVLARALPLLGVLLAAACMPAAPVAVRPVPAHLVDDVAAARLQLEEERGRAASQGGSPAERVRRLTALGLYDAADSLLRGIAAAGPDLGVAAAELRLRQHRYREAEAMVEAALASDARHPAARMARARLQVQAWDLPGAAATLEALLAARPADPAATLLLGRVRLLERRYDEALRLAEGVLAADPDNARAHLLAADVHFWREDPAAAEASLVRALEADPLDPDARFAYGYALWRRVDAGQLDAMAAQWNLALELDPLHYLTHWHFGNGHTHRTYRDYATAADSAVRASLAPGDSLIARGRVAEAVALAREVEREHPGSVLPPMLRASAFYLGGDLPRAERLDSAQAVFRDILAWKRNYGPAHNGLAAVIKQRQVEVLAAYDSLEAAIAATPTPPDSAFAAVFPDARWYPGDRVEKMARQQLGAAAAYLPLIARQGRRYRIPPLHRDLAAALGDAWFRTAATFDHRQWMDIRGVGSGAAGIEYVERGSHQERNVLLHEFVHLVHEIVLTDVENRRIRDLYLRAVQEGRTLDYYAANNESEFLGQVFTAYVSPVLVHPLNHKSMATRDDLRTRDPATFAFVDSLVSRAEAALGGRPEALRSNWAQAYLNLAERARARADDPERWAAAAALLDTALVHDAAYLPAMLGYAALERDRGQAAEAEQWLARAERLDPLHAPILEARAAAAPTVDEAAALLRRAVELETDPTERARLGRVLRTTLRDHGRVLEAIEAAEAYAAAAPTVSTYLRDRRDEAEAFALELRAGFGYGAESAPGLRALLARRPRDVALRARLSDALVGAGRLAEALDVLEQGQRDFVAAGAPHPGLAARVAEIAVLRGDAGAARAAVRPLLDTDPSLDDGDLRVVRVLQALEQTTEANRRLGAFRRDASPRARAEFEYTRGWLDQWRGDAETAERAYRAALDADPYHAGARVRLAALLRDAGRHDEAREVAEAADSLLLPAGPALREALRAGAASGPGS